MTFKSAFTAIRRVLVEDASRTSGLFALRSHKWTGRQLGGDPAEAGSYEWVRYCEVCGMEDTCEDPMPPCPGADAEDASRRGEALRGLVEAADQAERTFAAWAESGELSGNHELAARLGSSRLRAAIAKAREVLG